MKVAFPGTVAQINTKIKLIALLIVLSDGRKKLVSNRNAIEADKDLKNYIQDLLVAHTGKYKKKL